MMLRGWVIGMVLGIWVSGGAIAAQDSQLDEVQKRRQVEAARLEAEIRDGLQQADKLKSTDPAKAIALLEALLEKLAAESVLSIAKTADYRLAIKERLQTMRTAQARAGSEAALQRAGQAELDQRLNRLKALAEKDAALRRDLAEQVMEEQLFRRLVELNFAGAKVPRFVWLERGDAEDG